MTSADYRSLRRAFFLGNNNSAHRKRQFPPKCGCVINCDLSSPPKCAMPGRILAAWSINSIISLFRYPSLRLEVHDTHCVTAKRSRQRLRTTPAPASPPTITKRFLKRMKTIGERWQGKVHQWLGDLPTLAQIAKIPNATQR